jgi:hypothetical protein
MSQCPYPETFTDQVSAKTASNSLYIVWHEGYEAHKFEIANLSIKLACLAVELETEIRNVMELKSKLEQQIAKF